VNNKIYIGVHKTENIDDGYMGSGTLLMRAIDKYGIDNFIKEILFKASSAEEMFEREKELVEINIHTYNIKCGGHGGFDYVNKLVTPEERRNRGRLGGLKGGKHPNSHIMTNDRKNKMSIANKGEQAFLGKKHTKETKIKMSLARKGKHLGVNGRCWITKDNINRQIKITELSNWILEGWSKGRYFPSGNKPIIK
jgi:hypothetical protein